MTEGKNNSSEKNELILLILVLIIFSIAFGSSFYASAKEKAAQRNDSSRIETEKGMNSFESEEEFCQVDNLDCLFVGCNSYF